MDLLAFFHGTLIWGHLLFEIKTSACKCFRVSWAKFAKSACMSPMCQRGEIQPKCIILQEKIVAMHFEKHMHVY